MTLFQRARLKLTAWYLLILMVVSIAFSLVIFGFLKAELERFRRVQFRSIPPSMVNQAELLVTEAERRVIYRLVWINITIAAAAGGLGYLLAGRTLRPIKQMLDEQNRFISDASHEIKTPLTSLKIAFEVFLRDKKRSLRDAEVVIAESVSEVNRLQALSESLLSLAQYQLPNAQTHFERISTAKVLAESVRQIEPQAKIKKIVFVITGADYELQANSQALVNVFVILLDNAVKYSPAKSTITVVKKKVDGWIHVSVVDTGIGIAAKDLPHIFDRFYRADTARSKTTSGGYGLGLSIAQKIVAEHGGSLEIKSALHKGTTCIVKLPLKGTSTRLLS